MRKVLILLLVVGVLIMGTFSVIEELTEEMYEYTECAGGSFGPPKSGGSTINGGDSGPIGGGGGAPG